MKTLKLKRPIVFLDLETTGPDVTTDRIVQMALIYLREDGTQKAVTWFLNPEMPIPVEATAVHGITDADVADAPTFEGKAGEILALLSNCDLAGFGLRRFDVPLLLQEFARAGHVWKPGAIIDALSIFHLKNPRTLSAAFEEYVGEPLVDAHDAYADALAALRVLDAQLSTHTDLPRDVEGLAEFCAGNALDLEGKFEFNAVGEAAFTFGKHRGKTLAWVAKNEPGFLSWMLRADFSTEVKQIARQALVCQFPKRIQTARPDAVAAHEHGGPPHAA